MIHKRLGPITISTYAWVTAMMTVPAWLLLVSRLRLVTGFHFVSFTKVPWGMNVHSRPYTHTCSRLALASLSPELIHDLDLEPLMEQIASYTVTLRGKRALLGLVRPIRRKSTGTPLANHNSKTDNNIKHNQSSNNKWTSRQRRAKLEVPFQRTSLTIEPATNAKQARQAYEIVEQAQFVIQQVHSSDNPYKMTLAPMHTSGCQSEHDSTCDDDAWPTMASPADTDDDEWLDIPPSEWTLQDIIKAEKVTERLLALQAWCNLDGIATWAPLLAETANEFNTQAAESLRALLLADHLAGAVEIVRVKTAMDPAGRKSFHFRLSANAYPILGILREHLQHLQQQQQSSKQKHLEEKLASIQQALEDAENDIIHGLVHAIARRRKEIDLGLAWMAKLDIIFAKAAWGGVIPHIPLESCIINVAGFLHPLITKGNVPVPIDLRLGGAAGCDKNISRTSALIISGSNGGGKTVAMKSFGMVAQMVKLGIPIPTYSPSEKSQKERPAIGFYGQILTSLGDRQSVAAGQSTFMAQLATYATILEMLKEPAQTITEDLVNIGQKHTLVLLDELGSGTESEGGGTIAQAVLEHMLDAPNTCHIIATTHSPRLKTLSFQDDRFACASVVLETTVGSTLQVPTYKLEYGLIGESFPLSAAQRVDPRLPESVLQRAAALGRSAESENPPTGDTPYKHELTAYAEALIQSMELQQDRLRSEKEQAEEYRMGMQTCQLALVKLAQQYSRQLAYWESKVADGYSQLKQQNRFDSLELLGRTLDDLRVVQKRLQNDAERLRERGLRLVSDQHVFSPGESVVLVGGVLDGTEGNVVIADESKQNDFTQKLGPNEILVSVFDWESGSSRTMAFGRHEIAVWDGSLWEVTVDTDNMFAGSSTTSPRESRQASQLRLNGIFATLGSGAKSLDVAGSNKTGKDEISAKANYSSARARKASKKKKR